MFNNPPRIFAHKAIVDQGNFVLPNYILNKGDNTVNLFHRFCPHRMYPLHTPGEHIENIHCKLHAFEWSKDGTPLNNPKKIQCGTTTTGRSGLVFKNFEEPDHKWVNDLASETNLIYSHCYQGESNGSWLWLMDIEADLIHVYNKGIHPFLAKQIDLESITLEESDDWVIQYHPNGWWLYIFPFTFIEYGYPNGCVMINTIIPNNVNNEYGYTWISQYYYNPDIGPNVRLVFETAESVFKQDVAASEILRGDYFPLMNAINRYEQQCVHFGNWVNKNKIK